MQKMTGKFIVIDGTDGSGKATQTKLLVERMMAEGIPVKTISFPQYGKKSCGPVEKYLSGKYGTADEVGAKAASILYAVDRFDASFEMRQDLEAGTNIVADRYVGSNLGHQGSKIEDSDERKEFYKWNRELEHILFSIPTPDVNIVLHVPTATAIQLAKDRGGWKADIKTDIHETNPDHLRKAEQTYLELTELFDEFKLVECVINENLMSREDIHNKVWEIVKNILNS
ncbi:thymidylate kinase [Candidatus Uhrbacteria bacterium CG_4_9_14_0_2_um_filter_41_50]|uniref:Thymidylate kinase n=1 Tax=Candidatus Uhrbacteria bacterium CG_4_9_14_0_2_um_filter_41_50 TaxID=1975031 RepID=A0A2M8ENR4_9BACT|nr:MAG: thymidylate kinase [Candidatus Uhrbacteria bacterium CG_4_10_14_3_um_filter_41_21]PIZ54228.1 MAG: thymidylate kinase [Candidatus Uhrbacteria bacterium CG_4_10_14_0_2_um_filter_41_21]PJB84398.1 MAG: thymidylate kinase [Candidatus Uhrbacteria bacterium CG_4_9_14_0_8_um_filter_41_16]PJC24368.1 MAG: thymidylate kinase [Candidatus Uhrbacteria bacterium CG_4_9_14_0_2_um_filter_41_50]PJE75269.1 MAG: thymidylate kinase [Candidatus Uhrbacteria bacterium CG10_big_fil_rev_8_21_14_0_10_41_26]